MASLLPPKLKDSALKNKRIGGEVLASLHLSRAQVGHCDVFILPKSLQMRDHRSWLGLISKVLSQPPFSPSLANGHKISNHYFELDSEDSTLISGCSRKILELSFEFPHIAQSCLG